MSDAFEIYRYIQRRMRVSRVPAWAISGDTSGRIMKMAKRALEVNTLIKKRTEELYFIKVGDRWIGELRDM